MIIEEENFLRHYGTLRKSGRYPYGSGGDAGEHSQRDRSFLAEVDRLKKSGMSETQIAQGFGLTSTQLRARKSIAVNREKQDQIDMAQRLKDKGYGNSAIGQRMGINESTVRGLLAPGRANRAEVLESTAAMLKEQVDKKGFIDIGLGVENHLGLSKDRLAVAAAILEEKGLKIHTFNVEQATTGKNTKFKVIGPADSTQKEAWMAAQANNIHLPGAFSTDGGKKYTEILPPTSISSKKVAVKYAEDGGTEADGVMYLRRGAPGLDMGAANYSQVRIAVDGTHYLKGMAVYKDDLPAGTDIVFNTNKPRGTPMMGPKENTVLKPMKDDADNPFGATISRQNGHLNIVNEEGDWQKWSKSLSSQVLSKQSPKLAKEQLDMTYESRKQQFDEIKALSNPAVKAKLLESFSDDADAAAVHLKAAALPNQSSHVLIPIKSMKPGEIYAPNFEDGDNVALVRYPHGGTFEIPELRVNNKNREARATLGPNPSDVVGIHHSVAERLSGADFDGDTVLVIRNNNGKIKSTPALEGLKDFDPKKSFPLPEGQKFTGNTQQLMGSVSNLITDMTIKGASTDELARAVRHSMVAIDAEKHGLDHKASSEANGIPALKRKYQTDEGKTPRGNAGAATLISRATSEERVNDRKERTATDPTTGEKIFFETGRTYINAKGVVTPRTTSSTKLAETNDARTLVSNGGRGTPIERVYADHSNRLKALANEARLESTRIRPTPYSPTAKAAYSKEVAKLDADLNLALKNAPLERQAQLLANSEVSQKRAKDPTMGKAELKKAKAQALVRARARTGAGKTTIVISDDQWAAIQAGAVSNSKLSRILNNADMERVKELATPKRVLSMTSTKTTRARSMLASGYTQAEVAKALGVSLTTLKSAIA